MDNTHLEGKVENIHEETSAGKTHQVLLETAKPNHLLQLFLEGAAGSSVKNPSGIPQGSWEEGSWC